MKVVVGSGYLRPLCASVAAARRWEEEALKETSRGRAVGVGGNVLEGPAGFIYF